LSLVSGTQHQRGLAVERIDDRIPAKDHSGTGPRKARKHQAGYHGEDHDANEDLDRCHAVPVHGVRIHVSITHRCECFDTEKECVGKGPRSGIGYAVRAGEEYESKNRIAAR